MSVESLTHHIPAKETKEFVRPTTTNVVLVGMQGEGGFSLHDPIALGVLAKRIKTDHEDSTVTQIDTQPELHRNGKIDTDALAKRLYKTVITDDSPNKATILGFSMPIFSLNYTQATLIKYQQLCEELGTPQGRVEIALGGSIPSHTDTKLLKPLFPDATFVKGWGEERFSTMLTQLKKGEPLEGSKQFEYSDLATYAGADRELTKETILLGGKPKTEFSRGCGFGNCTFCSRDSINGTAGKDYRNVPIDGAIKELQTIDDVFVEVSRIHETADGQTLQKRFEITDEDAFSFPDLTHSEKQLTHKEQQAALRRNAQHVINLVSALKEAQTREDNPLTKMPFSASMRVDSILKLESIKSDDGTSLLDQLIEVGLDQVFLGVESATNDSLNQMGKGQRKEDVIRAIKIVQEKKITDDKTQTETPLGLEIGFITFSYRMDMEMLKNNVRFLSQVAGDETESESKDITQTNAQYVSALFNTLEVRAGTKDERTIKKYTQNAQKGDSTYQAFANYDTTTKFNLNTSAYEDVPFLDPDVAQAYEQTMAYARAEANLYYTLKSAKRASSTDKAQNERIQHYALTMKKLQLQFLRHTVGLEEAPDCRENRKNLIMQMMSDLDQNRTAEDGLDSLRREIRVFLQEETERSEAQGMQVGATLVLTDDKDRILLVRPKGQNEWAFPGGNVKEGESFENSAIRETQEELGLLEEEKITIKKQLPSYQTENHTDKITGPREGLLLIHYLGKKPAGIDIKKGDHEIVDTLCLSVADICARKIPVKPNVLFIANHLRTVRDTHHKQE